MVFQMKIPVLESPFNKTAGLQPCNFIKARLQYRCFPVEFAKNFNNTFFYRTLAVAAAMIFQKLD